MNAPVSIIHGPCAYSFSNRYFSVDTKERPFACVFCRRAFVRKDILSRHLKSFHPDLGGPGEDGEIQAEAPGSAADLSSILLDFPTYRDNTDSISQRRPSQSSVSSEIYGMYLYPFFSSSGIVGLYIYNKNRGIRTRLNFSRRREPNICYIRINPTSKHDHGSSLPELCDTIIAASKPGWFGELAFRQVHADS